MLEVGIRPVAYCPLTNPGYDEFGPPQPVFEHETVVEIANKHGATPAQIILAWGIARGHCVIPKTSKKERLSENFGCLKITLSQEEVESITKLDCGWRALSSKKLPWTLGWDLFA